MPPGGRQAPDAEQGSLAVYQESELGSVCAATSPAAETPVTAMLSATPLDRLPAKPVTFTAGKLRSHGDAVRCLRETISRDP